MIKISHERCKNVRMMDACSTKISHIEKKEFCKKACFEELYTCLLDMDRLESM